MRRRILMVSAVLTMPIAGACGGSSSNGAQNGPGVAQAGTAAKTDKAADEAALRAIYQKMPAQVMSGDTASMGAMFGSDGIELMPGAPPAQGSQAVNKEFASAFGMMKNINMSMGDITVTVADAGDLAVVRAPYHMTYTDAKGKKAEDHGSSLTVFHKVDGQWKILYDLNVSEVAPQ